MAGLINLVMLGSGGVMPTRERLTPSVLVYDWNGYTLLLDAGEGAQLRLHRTPRSVHDLDAIIVTHEHGDHVNGLAGLLQSMAVSRRRRPLSIIGPSTVVEFARDLLEATSTRLGFEISYVTLSGTGSMPLYRSGGDVLELKWAPSCHTNDSLAYRVEWRTRPRIDKSMLNALGLKPGPWIKELVERGSANVNGRRVKLEDISSHYFEASIVYTGDTAPCQPVIELSSNAVILLHEATYGSDMEDEAISRGHSTAEHAALVALEAGVRNLVLFHVSPRYRGRDARKLYLEAKRLFNRTVLSWDMMRVSLGPLRRIV
ncbi:MAG: MBL fold metallo-hydrolase [Desulfurococcales archaeon]|nr:MBL fold metallo-hydrolase [Desulfurococcales archaeon]